MKNMELDQNSIFFFGNSVYGVAMAGSRKEMRIIPAQHTAWFDRAVALMALHFCFVCNDSHHLVMMVAQ